MPDDIESLLEPEYAPHYNSWMQNKTPENNARLLKSVNPVLTAAMRQFGIPNSPTMASRAKIMALGSLQRYDPSKSKLKTFLMSQMQGLRRYAAKEQQILSIPEQVALDLTHLRNAENTLRDQLGRDPSDTELADHINIPIKRIEYIRRAKPVQAESAFHKSTDEGEDLYAPQVQAKQKSIRHWHEFVYQDLGPIDQLIMEHTLGLHNKPVLQNYELAKKLGISPGAVSQRKARIQGKLDLRDDLTII